MISEKKLIFVLPLRCLKLSENKRFTNGLILHIPQCCCCTVLRKGQDGDHKSKAGGEASWARMLTQGYDAEFLQACQSLAMQNPD